MLDWYEEGLEPSYNLLDSVPDWAKPAIACTNDLQAWLCGRRAAKTSSILAKVLQEGIPGEVHPYVTTTKQKAREITWPVLERFQKDYNVKLDFNRTTGEVISDRGVHITCEGLSTAPEVEKLRGQRFPGIVFDEAQALKDDLFRRALFEAAQPATADFYQRGGFGVICSGTAGYAPTGLWHELTGGNDVSEGKYGTSVFRATILDNPYIRNAAVFLEKLRARMHWTDDDPVYQREWLGRWCVGGDGLCYGRSWCNRYMPRYMMPLTGFTIMALDFGEVRPCAWVVIRIVPFEEQIGDYIHKSFHVHVLHAKEIVCNSIHEITAITRALVKEYHVGLIVGDSAEGFGIRHMNDVFGMNIIPAFKHGAKAERIFLTCSMLRAGTCHLYEGCEVLGEEFMTVPWNDERTDHHASFNDHALDALHYALEQAFQVMQVKPAQPAPGSEAALEQKRLEMRKRILGQHLKKPKYR